MDYQDDIYNGVFHINESYMKMLEESMKIQKRKEDVK